MEHAENTSLRVCFASAEAAPFAKAGGLADVAGALPKALKVSGAAIIIFIPKYGSIDDEEFELSKVDEIPDTKIAMGSKHTSASLWKAQLHGSCVETYFIGNTEYFSRKGIYNDPKTGEGYRDNHERYIFFMRALLSFIEALDWKPDVIHCNDYQTGLIPAYLKTLYSDNPFYRDVSTLYTIHNLQYQGIYPKKALSLTGFPEDAFYPLSPFEFWGNVNFMKAGIVYADVLNTVSQRYAEEIQTAEEFGYGLEGLLKDRSEDLHGIVNGIDYSIWNPATDELMPFSYTPDDLSGKRKNKEELLKQNGLPILKEDVPLIGIISRLADQKGFDLIEKAADKMMSLDLQVVVLGTGQKKYHDMLQMLEREYPEKIKVNLAFDNRLAHLIEAGSDMFLMPSRFEPCGLNQLYSLKYGTIPIVRRTGGLADTIDDYDQKTGKGTGFVFSDYSPDAMLEAICRAVGTYQNKDEWTNIMQSTMSKDFSWESSAKKYIQLYEKAISKRRA